MKLWNRVFQGAVLLGGVVALPSMAWERSDGVPAGLASSDGEGIGSLAQDPHPQDSAAQSRAVLGISTEEVGSALASHVHLDPGMGVLITHVSSGGAAEGSGLAKHDIIFQLGGAEIAGLESLRRQLRGMEGGEQVHVGVIRGGEAMDFTVTLGSEPVLVRDSVEQDRARAEAEIADMAAQIDALAQAVALYKPNHSKYQALNQELNDARDRYNALQARAQELANYTHALESQRAMEALDSARANSQDMSVKERMDQIQEQWDARVAYLKQAERLMRDSQLDHGQVVEQLAEVEQEGWNRMVLERSLADRSRRVQMLSDQVAEAEARLAMMRELEAQQGLAAEERAEAELRLVELHESLAKRSAEQAEMESRLAAERDRAAQLAAELADVQARVDQEAAARRSLEAKENAYREWQATLEQLELDGADIRQDRGVDMTNAMEAMKRYQERAEMERAAAEELRIEAERRAAAAESARRDAERRALEAALAAERAQQQDQRRALEEARLQLEAARAAAEGRGRRGSGEPREGESGVRGELQEIRERLDRIEEMLERALRGGEVVMVD